SHFFEYRDSAVGHVARFHVPNSVSAGTNFLNTGLLGRERQDFNLLAFVQFLQTNLYSVPEFHGVPIGSGIRRQLTEGRCFGRRQTMSLLERRRDPMEQESSPVRNADRTHSGFGGKHPF